jgi:rubredoxin
MANTRESIRAAYDKAAATYGETYANELVGKPFDRFQLDWLAASMPAGGRLLELGCGPGHIGAYLAARGVPAEGIDLSPAMLAEARRRTAASLRPSPWRPASPGRTSWFASPTRGAGIPASGPISCSKSQPERRLKEGDMRYICANCGYIYDPDIGDAEGGIDPGTAFEDLPEDWTCPVCYQPRRVFDPLD